MDKTIKAFMVLGDADDVWERDSLGDLWALNYDKACDVLIANGINDTDTVIEMVADYYGIDVD